VIVNEFSGRNVEFGTPPAPWVMGRFFGWFGTRTCTRTRTTSLTKVPNDPLGTLSFAVLPGIYQIDALLVLVLVCSRRSRVWAILVLQKGSRAKQFFPNKRSCRFVVAV